PGAALFQEPLQALVARGGADLDRRGVRATGAEKRDIDLLTGDVLPRPRREPEQARQVFRRGVPIGDGDGHVGDALDLDHGLWGGQGGGPAKRWATYISPPTI